MTNLFLCCCACRSWSATYAYAPCAASGGSRASIGTAFRCRCLNGRCSAQLCRLRCHSADDAQDAGHSPGTTGTLCREISSVLICVLMICICSCRVVWEHQHRLRHLLAFRLPRSDCIPLRSPLFEHVLTLFVWSRQGPGCSSAKQCAQVIRYTESCASRYLLHRQQRRHGDRR